MVLERAGPEVAIYQLSPHSGSDSLDTLRVPSLMST